MQTYPRNYLVYRRFARLIVAALILQVFALAVAGTPALYASLCASVTVLAPQFYFARRALKYFGARFAKQIVASFYMAEALKLALTLIMAVSFIKLLQLNVLWFVVSFSSLQLIYALLPLGDVL